MLLVPHIFRYLPLVSIPLCLALAAYLREGLLRHRGVGAAMTVGFVGLSIVQCVALTAPTRDAFGEQRRAIAVLRDFPEEPVWCDDFFSFRFMSFARSSQEAHRVRLVRVDDPVRQALFATIKDGIVVTGGSSLPWWGLPALHRQPGRSSGSSTGPSRPTARSRSVSGACRPPRARWPDRFSPPHPGPRKGSARSSWSRRGRCWCAPGDSLPRRMPSRGPRRAFLEQVLASRASL